MTRRADYELAFVCLSILIVFGGIILGSFVIQNAPRNSLDDYLCAEIERSLLDDTCLRIDALACFSDEEKIFAYEQRCEE